MPTIDEALAAVRLAYTLDPQSPRPLTADERHTLQAFMGWGQFAAAFAPQPAGKYVAIADELDDILPSKAWRAAANQVDTSFFTPDTVTAAVYDVLRSVGFRGGRAFEPGCGAGAFMSSAPADMAIDWTGVEIDPTSARIASLLHPEAEVIVGALETTVVREGTFDVAVGNVPFSEAYVHDKMGRSGSLHNYFIARAAAAVRPGGYVVLVTSRHTLDAERNGLLSGTPLDWCAFEGAVRLPSGAFSEAGTEAVTDLIVLRRLAEGEEREFYTGTPEFTRTQRYAYGYTHTDTVDNGVIVTSPANGADGISTRVSAYWGEHPEHVAGEMMVTTFNRSPLIVRPRADDAAGDVAGDVARAVRALTPGLPALAAPSLSDSLEDVILEDADGRKENSFHVIDGAMHRVVNGVLTPARNNKELAALVALRDVTSELITLESDVSLPDAALDDTRAAAFAQYQAYVAKYGHLNRGTLVEGAIDEESGLPALSWRRPAMGGFRRDPDSALVMALEVYDQSSGEARPADILTRRVNRRPEPVQSADSPAEALAISMGESGRVDLDRIAGLLGLDVAGARQALGTLVFDDPDDGLVSASEYLSGNVRHKLNRALALGLTAHADALQAVIPADVGPLEISLNLGHPLISPAEIAAFIKDDLQAGNATVRHEPHLGTWEVDSSAWSASNTALIQWGTPDMKPAQLVEHALNGRTPDVYTEVYNAASGSYRRVRLADESAAAAEKLEAIRDRFSVWVWEDEARATRLVAEYNARYNSYVPRVFTGDGLVFPGMAESFVPWAHQRAAVERILHTPATLIGHPVGAGKSATMALSAVTLRALGLANKPLIVVPNHLLEQMAREAQQVVPTAKLLVATKEDLARGNRRLFAARCATGDWDAIIMTHSAFTMIPVHPETEREWMMNEEFNLRRALNSLDGYASGTKGAKAIARRMRSFTAKAAKLRSNMGDQDAIYFEQLGVDYVMVDEAHMFRRLDTYSTQRGSGFGTGSSKRATDLLLKVESLRERRPGAPIAAMFTGTPWSNTLAETWVWQRFLQPEVLADMQLTQFDAWVGVFVKYETAVEVAPDGSGFRSFRRPTGLVNVPELKTMLAQVADILAPESLQLERPEVLTHTVAVSGSDAQREFVSGLAERAENLRSGSADKATDNMLVIITDGRKVALDPRLVGLDEESPKVTAFADKAAVSYHENKHRTFGDHPVPGGFQLAFCDLGTPNTNSSQTYGRLRSALVKRGVPANMVRFVHDASTDKARAALFAACRNGEVAVLIGSTPKVGMGTNVQTRLTDLHNIDAPWLPSDVTQRTGRGDRHGNLSGTMHLHRYIAEGTFDAYIWQTLERKSRSFDALYATGASAREVEDVSAATMTYGEMKAIASGNPLLLEQAEARAELKRLRLMRAVHIQSVTAAKETAKRLSARVLAARRMAADLLDAADAEIPVITAAHITDAVERWMAYGRGYDRFTAGRATLAPVFHREGDKYALASVTVSVNGHEIGFVRIPATATRRGAGAVAALVAPFAAARLGSLAERAEGLIEDADRDELEAAAATRAAEEAVFSHEDALALAVERMARIEMAIADKANEDQKVPVGA